jgi:hypothetical protein
MTGSTQISKWRWIKALRMLDALSAQAFQNHTYSMMGLSIRLNSCKNHLA